MNIRSVILLAAAWLILSACSSVYSPQPLGGEPLVLDSSWSGTWKVDDGVLTTAVVDKQKGLLQIASLEAKSGGIDIETFQAFVKTRGDTVIVNVKDKESEHGYHWFVVDKEAGRYALLWGPDAEAFKAAILAGKLPGQLLNPDDEDSDDVVLGELEQAHYEMIADPASGLIDWKDPAVLIRISD